MSATLIDNDLDTDILGMLDFEFAPPCEAPAGCDGTAEWTIRTGCCGHLYILCQECCDSILEWITRCKAMPALGIQCKQCDNIVPVNSFIHSVERI